MGGLLQRGGAWAGGVFVNRGTNDCTDRRTDGRTDSLITLCLRLPGIKHSIIQRFFFDFTTWANRKREDRGAEGVEWGGCEVASWLGSLGASLAPPAWSGMAANAFWHILKSHKASDREKNATFAQWLHIFSFWTPHFFVWTPHFGWTPRLNYTLA